MSKYSKKAEKAIGEKMDKMKNEDKPQKQKVAIALSEAREKGLKVPEKKEESKKHESMEQHHDPSEKHEMLELKEHKRKA